MTIQNEITVNDAFYKRFCSTVRMRFPGFDKFPAQDYSDAIDTTIQRFFDDHGVVIVKEKAIQTF